MPFFAFIPSTSTNTRACWQISVPTRQQQRPHPRKRSPLHKLEKIQTTRTCLQTTTTATTLATSRVRRNGGNVLDSADSHTGTGEGTESGLGTGTGGLGAVTTGSTDLDVQSVDAEFLAAGGNVLGSQHGGVGGGLVTVSLDLHTTGDTADGFATTVPVISPPEVYLKYAIAMCDEPQIGNVDEGIVERGEDTGNTENELAYHILLAALRFNAHNIIKNIPSPARGPRVTFSLGAAGAFLGAIVNAGGGMEYGERKKKK